MNKLTEKIISSFIVIAMAVTQVMSPLPANAATAVSMPGEVKVPNAFALNLPTDLGTIERLIPGAMQTLFHIQDAHGNFEAQKNTQAILHHLHKQYGLDLILMEGASEKLKPELFRFFPERMDLTMEIADGLTKDAILKGAELFLLEAADVPAYGIETLQTYDDNVSVFKTVIKQQAQTEGFIRALNMQIERLTSPYLNKELRVLLKRVDAFEAGELPLEKWLDELKEQAKSSLKIDLDSPNFQFEWPMLTRLFKLRDFENRLDAAAYKNERTDFLKAAKVLPQDIYETLEALLTAPLSRHQLSDPATGYLFEKMVEALGKDFNYETYPNVNMFMGHLILQSELKGDKLMVEVDKLTEKTLNRLAKDETEKKILSLLQDHRILKKLFALELTPKDFDRLLERKDQMRPDVITERFLSLNGKSLVRNIEFENIEQIQSLYESATEFYVLVKKRDEAMLQNIEARIKQTGAKKIAVITGGFHAGPFQDFFSKQSFNYALISPKITKIIEDRSAYLSAILEEDASKYLASTLMARLASLGRNDTGYFAPRVATRIAEVIGQNGLAQPIGKNTVALRMLPEVSRFEMFFQAPLFDRNVQASVPMRSQGSALVLAGLASLKTMTPLAASETRMSKDEVVPSADQPQGLGSEVNSSGYIFSKTLEEDGYRKTDVRRLEALTTVINQLQPVESRQQLLLKMADYLDRLSRPAAGEKLSMKEVESFIQGVYDQARASGAAESATRSEVRRKYAPKTVFLDEKIAADQLAAKLREPLATEDAAMQKRLRAGGYGRNDGGTAAADGYGVSVGAAIHGSMSVDGDQGYYTIDATGNMVGREAFLQTVASMSDFFNRRKRRNALDIKLVIKPGIGGQHTPFEGLGQIFSVGDASTEKAIIQGEYELGKDFITNIRKILDANEWTWDQVAIIPSSKSGSTDETMLVFTDIMLGMLGEIAEAYGVAAEEFAALVAETLHEVNFIDGKEKPKGDLFKVEQERFGTTSLITLIAKRAKKAKMSVDREDIQTIFADVLGNMFFETTDIPEESRLSAFIRNSGLAKDLGTDQPGFGAMFENVGGRWTADLHMMTFLAYYNLDANAYWQERYNQIRNFQDGKQPGVDLADRILDEGFTDIALVVPDSAFWLGKSIEQNFNESIWQNGFANLVAIPESLWTAQQGNYRVSPTTSLVINASKLKTDGKALNLAEVDRLRTKDKQELAIDLAKFFSTFYSLTSRVGDRLIARALREAGFKVDDVELNNLDNRATQIVQANLYVRQPYVELGKGLLETTFNQLQAEEAQNPGAIQLDYQARLQSARNGQLQTNIEHSKLTPNLTSIEQIGDAINALVTDASLNGRKFVPFLYLEGKDFIQLRKYLTKLGIEWVMQGTGDQHISFQQVLRQPQKYLPFIISFVSPKPRPARRAIGFAKPYLDRVSADHVRDAFAEASYNALMSRPESQGAFLRLPRDRSNVRNVQGVFGQTFARAEVRKPGGNVKDDEKLRLPMIGIYLGTAALIIVGVLIYARWFNGFENGRQRNVSEVVKAGSAEPPHFLKNKLSVEEEAEIAQQYVARFKANEITVSFSLMRDKDVTLGVLERFVEGVHEEWDKVVKAYQKDPSKNYLTKDQLEQGLGNIGDVLANVIVYSKNPKAQQEAVRMLADVAATGGKRGNTYLDFLIEHAARSGTDGSSSFRNVVVRALRDSESEDLDQAVVNRRLAVAYIKSLSDPVYQVRLFSAQDLRTVVNYGGDEDLRAIAIGALQRQLGQEKEDTESGRSVIKSIQSSLEALTARSEVRPMSRRELLTKAIVVGASGLVLAILGIESLFRDEPVAKKPLNVSASQASSVSVSASIEEALLALENTHFSSLSSVEAVETYLKFLDHYDIEVIRAARLEFDLQAIGRIFSLDAKKLLEAKLPEYQKDWDEFGRQPGGSYFSKLAMARLNGVEPGDLQFENPEADGLETPRETSVNIIPRSAVTDLTSAGWSSVQRTPDGGISFNFDRDNGVVQFDLETPIPASTLNDIRVVFEKLNTRFTQLTLRLEGKGGQFEVLELNSQLPWGPGTQAVSFIRGTVDASGNFTPKDSPLNGFDVNRVTFTLQTLEGAELNMSELAFRSITGPARSETRQVQVTDVPRVDVGIPAVAPANLSQPAVVNTSTPIVPRVATITFSEFNRRVPQTEAELRELFAGEAYRTVTEEFAAGILVYLASVNPELLASVVSELKLFGINPVFNEYGLDEVLSGFQQYAGVEGDVVVALQDAYLSGIAETFAGRPAGSVGGVIDTSYVVQMFNQPRNLYTLLRIFEAVANATVGEDVGLLTVVVPSSQYGSKVPFMKAIERALQNRDLQDSLGVSTFEIAELVSNATKFISVVSVQGEKADLQAAINGLVAERKGRVATVLADVLDLDGLMNFVLRGKVIQQNSAAIPYLYGEILRALAQVMDSIESDAYLEAELIKGELLRHSTVLQLEVMARGGATYFLIGTLQGLVQWLAIQKHVEIMA